jgi:hypothetical protein
MPSTNASAIPYVLQRDFLSVIVTRNGVPEQVPVSSSQPTFKALKKALEKQQWGRIPKLLDVTQQIAQKSHGKVKVTKEGIFYKGNKVQNVLTAKIMELMEHGQKVDYMLRFMDNLYQQPDMATVNEVYEWLNSGRFCLTSDGCFVAYKVVRANYKDKHTGTVDNHIGARPLMARSAVDPDRRNECSRGYHFCSRGYIPNFLSNGDHLMTVKVNPADVVAIPEGYGFSKGRCWTYEVTGEIEPDQMVSRGEGDAPVMMEAVIEIPDERPDIIRKVKALPTVKRLMRRGKLTAASFRKASTERLVGWLRKFSRMDVAPSKSKLFDNPLRFAREAAGLTLGQVAKAAGLSLQETYNAERCLKPSQDVIDQLLIAIASLQGNNDIGQAGVSYPRPSAKNTNAYTPGAAYSSTEEDDEEVWDDEDEDEDF